MQGTQTPVTFSRDLTKEAPCHEGQIPWDTPASLGVRASCPSSCSSHTRMGLCLRSPKAACASDLTLRTSVPPVKRQTQSHFTRLADRSGQSLGGE